jgi:hypothetical protein
MKFGCDFTVQNKEKKKGKVEKPMAKGHMPKVK